MAYVATLRSGEQWLFSSPAAKGGRTVDLDKPFRRCVLAAGLDVKQVVRHTLRHTAIRAMSGSFTAQQKATVIQKYFTVFSAVSNSYGTLTKCSLRWMLISLRS